MRRTSPLAVVASAVAVAAAAVAVAACGIAAGSPKASTTSSPGTTPTTTTTTTTTTVAPPTTTSTVPAPTTTTTVPPPPPPVLTTEVVKASRTGRHAYTVSCAHPVLSGAAGAGAVDAAISATVFNAVSSFESNANGSSPFPGSPAPSTLTCTWSKTWLSPTLGSVSFTSTGFMAGAAHPGAVTTTFTFDPASGRVYGLADLFLPGSDWLQLLTQQAHTLLSALPGFGNLGLPSGFGISQPKDFAAFELAPAGLQITFQEYQVAPYSYGQPTITIPYPVLASVADPTGPLAAMSTVGS